MAIDQVAGSDVLNDVITIHQEPEMAGANVPVDSNSKICPEASIEKDCGQNLLLSDPDESHRINDFRISDFVVLVGLFDDEYVF